MSAVIQLRALLASHPRPLAPEPKPFHGAVPCGPGSSSLAPSGFPGRCQVRPAAASGAQRREGRRQRCRLRAPTRGKSSQQGGEWSSGHPPLSRLGARTQGGDSATVEAALFRTTCRETSREESRTEGSKGGMAGLQGAGVIQEGQRSPSPRGASCHLLISAINTPSAALPAAPRDAPPLRRSRGPPPFRPVSSSLACPEIRKE